MKTLLAQIAAARMIALDWHYAAKGASFYAAHLLAEKVASEIGEQADALTETYYLGECAELPPKQADIAAEAAQIATYEGGADVAAKNLAETLRLIDAQATQLARIPSLSIGTKSILDSISQHALQLVGLVERTTAV